MDREAWWATVHGVAKSQTGLTEHAHRMTLGPFLHMSAPEYSEPYPVGLLRELKKRSPSSLMAHTWWLTLI